MEKVTILDLNVDVNAENDLIAEAIRKDNDRTKTVFINVMASPGAGKTTLIFETLKRLSKTVKTGIIEADIDHDIDAVKLASSGENCIQVHTGGECAMDAAMTEKAVKALKTQYGEDIKLMLLENIGNLVCPAENDVGADHDIAILSIPEGDDKPLKYPLMFEKCSVVLISKIDTEAYFNFDRQAVVERIHRKNPQAQVIFLSAKTGEGMDEWMDWLEKAVTKKQN